MIKGGIGKVSIRRGDIFQVSLGHTEQGEALLRPVLVIQNDVGNRLASTVIVVPLVPVDRAQGELISLPILRGSETGLDQDHVAVFSLIRTLARERFACGSRLGKVSRSDLSKVDRAICVSLGLSALQHLETRRN